MKKRHKSDFILHPSSSILSCVQAFIHAKIENLRDIGNPEKLVNLRIEVAQDQSAAHLTQPCVQGDEFADNDACGVVDLTEVEVQIGLTAFENQFIKLIEIGRASCRERG